MSVKKSAKRPARKTRKTAAKSADPKLVVQEHGGALLTGGVPGNRGGTGRPPDAFTAMCRELASSQTVELNVRAILENPAHPAYLGALKWASEHGYGKPKQEHELTASDSLAALIAGTPKA